ncbi:unnamed protein product [Mytilus coruscus]|uniref:Uncharacterized protein n=1 Tax=Mytilus coruscus TaxID=42192 RepID=A0A6J8DFS8_MYTCO|nr:unnamed protein product [Mytilus coruscus]
MYEKDVEKYTAELMHYRKNLDILINSYYSGELQTLEVSLMPDGIKTELSKYQQISEKFIGFLKRDRTAESARKETTQTLIYKSIIAKAKPILNEIEIKLKQAQSAKSFSIGRKSKSSSASSKLIKQRAKIDAAKTNLRFVSKEAELERLQFKLEEDEVKTKAELFKKKVETKLQMELLKSEKKVAIAEAEFNAVREELDMKGSRSSGRSMASVVGPRQHIERYLQGQQEIMKSVYTNPHQMHPPELNVHAAPFEPKSEDIRQTNYEINNVSVANELSKKKILRENNICYKCCESAKHIFRDCKESVTCKDSGSNQHSTAMHIDRNDQTVREIEPVSSHGGEGPLLQNVETKCTAICGEGFSAFAKRLSTRHTQQQSRNSEGFCNTVRLCCLFVCCRMRVTGLLVIEMCVLYVRAFEKKCDFHNLSTKELLENLKYRLEEKEQRENGEFSLYQSIAGGGSYAETGSGTNYLCLSHNSDQKPAQFSLGLERSNYVAHVWGAEYQFSFGMVKVDDDVPCAVCLDTTANTSLMIPAKSSCPSLWKKQYNGILCANMYRHPAASEYVCVDSDAQYFEGTSRRGSSDGKLFYPAVTVCGSLPCPPYENSKYLTCVVCSK